jgi:hypothetical protein
VQVWSDYLEAPEYVENPFQYVYTSRPKNLNVASLNDISGLFLVRADRVNILNNPVECWVNDSDGFVYGNLPLWSASTSYKVGDKVKTSTGIIYECFTAGISSTVEPTLGIDRTPVDGTVVWLGRNSSSRPAPLRKVY